MVATMGLCPVAFADSTDNTRLRQGEILHTYIRKDEPGGAVRAQVFIWSDIQSAWQLLKGCGKAFVFVDGLEVCDILEMGPEGARIHQVADPGILAPEQDYIYRASYQPPGRMDFELVEGSLETLEGSWQFSEMPGGFVIDYEMRVHTGLAIPRFLVRYSLRRTVTHMLACIRGLLQGSRDADMSERDLDRCPGRE